MRRIFTLFTIAISILLLVSCDERVATLDLSIQWVDSATVDVATSGSWGVSMAEYDGDAAPTDYTALYSSVSADITPIVTRTLTLESELADDGQKKYMVFVYKDTNSNDRYDAGEYVGGCATGIYLGIGTFTTKEYAEAAIDVEY